jgi:YesN/AraC family two-component response regulator
MVSNPVKTKVFYLKNLNSSCCLRMLRSVLEQAGIKVGMLRLGQATLTWDERQISETELQKLLTSNGFPVIKDKDQQLVEKIKIAVIELIQLSDNKNSIIRNSDYLVDRIGYSYQYLSSVFSKYEKTTLEKFIILHKIEKVKELIEYDTLTLSEIAWQMGYSSVQYLSAQFKKITGVTVSEYKNKGMNLRIPLDKI